ncbi:hypothetical protein FTG99_18760, partial [Salmonella enterica]|nr:hypothetical protein [Salmonella enterica]
ATPSAAFSSICCVMHLLSDPASRGRKRRYDYFLTVLYFRKISYIEKIGSSRNRHPVIRFRFYKLGCNCIWLKFQNEKDK